ncbi:MAG: PrsW family intramembrane metalloprotease [Halodesulfurarchaeum sp.]
MSWRVVLKLARWEVGRGAGSLDRRTLVVAALVIGGLGVAAPFVAAGGPAPDQGIYRVAVSEESVYAEPVRAAESLRRVPPTTQLGSGADLVIDDGVVRSVDSPKGRAARDALRRAVTRYNDRLMKREPDQAAAFPVRVSLRYASQDVIVAPTGNGEADGSSGGGSSGDGSGGAGDTGGDGSTSGGRDGLLESASNALLGGAQSGTPGGIRAPFPVRSLILAFLFVLPLNVVIQAFGSSIMAERLNRRGEALLVAPISRYAVVAGKTLPYFLGTIAVTIGIAAAVGGGVITVLAIVPLAGLFLSATFVAAMFARSYKELTFVAVGISVGITTFAFVPAIFSEVTPVAAISPLSLVVYDLTGGPITLVTLAFAVLPMSLVAVVLFALGVGVFREEDMFTQRGLTAKTIDAFAAQLPTARRVALWSALLVPIAFVVELFAVAALFAVRAPVTIPLLLAVIALIEEAAKSIHVYAGFRRGRFTDTDRAAILVGVLSGIGFAVAEKLVLIVQAVGLPEYLLARVAFAPAGLSNPLVVLGLLLAPFALHATTATVAALGARRGPTGYAVGFGTAALVHIGYNLVVVGAVA